MLRLAVVVPQPQLLPALALPLVPVCRAAHLSISSAATTMPSIGSASAPSTSTRSSLAKSIEFYARRTLPVPRRSRAHPWIIASDGGASEVTTEMCS